MNISIPVPVIAGTLGRRVRTYQTQIRPDQLRYILGHDPRSSNWKRLPDPIRRIYEWIQRRTSKDRRLGLEGYIDQRIVQDTGVVGALPAISVGMLQPARFESKREVCGMPEEVGILHISLSDINPRIVLDGLARVTAGLNLLDEGRLPSGDAFSYPVTFFTPSEESGAWRMEDLGQFFHDFNFLATAVSTNLAIALDQSDPYIKLTNELAESSVIADSGGMEMKKASLGKKSTAIVVQRVLLRFVRGAVEGRRYQESDAARPRDPNLIPETYDDLRNQLEDFLDGFASRLGEGRFKDRQSLHLTAPGWQVLGLIFHDLTFGLRESLSDIDRDEVLDKLAAVDWSRFNPDWIGMIGDPELDENRKPITDARGRQKVALSRAGRTTIAAMHRYVRDNLGISELLRQEEVQEAAASAAA